MRAINMMNATKHWELLLDTTVEDVETTGIVIGHQTVTEAAAKMLLNRKVREAVALITDNDNKKCVFGCNTHGGGQRVLNSVTGGGYFVSICDSVLRGPAGYGIDGNFSQYGTMKTGGSINDAAAAEDYIYLILLQCVDGFSQGAHIKIYGR